MKQKGSLFLLAILTLLLSLCSVKKVPPSTPDAVDIRLPLELRSSRMEFSSMAWYGKRLLLVPQYPDRFGGDVYTLEQKALESAVRGKGAVESYSIMKVLGLEEIKKKIGPSYEGLEATVVIGDRVFFTIESKETNTDCYIVSGWIEDGQIVLNPQWLRALPKIKRLSNAGFESLAWWKEKGCLVAFFEYNKQDAPPSAILIDTSLAVSGIKVRYNLPELPFRLTDAISSPVDYAAGSFLGLNFWYNGEKEFAEYVGADSVRIQKSEASLYGKSLRKTCYSRIVRLTLEKDGRASWKKVRDVSFGCTNWEGMAPFMNGLLLVNDEYTDTSPGSCLKWVKLN